MAYHDPNLVTDVAPVNSTEQRKDIEEMSDQSPRPFRRKAALLAEADLTLDPEADSGSVSEQIPEIDEIRPLLPMTLPEPWERLRRVPFGVRKHLLARAPLVNFFRADPAAKAFDVLRTRLLQTLKAQGWSRVAIAAPTSGCGTTFTAVNLALSLARVPETRTVLMDMNMRRPGVAAAMDIDSGGQMRRYLKGDVEMVDHLVRCSDGMAVGLSEGYVTDAAELLHAQFSHEVLDDLTDSLEPDVVLYDMPPVLEHDDLVAFTSQVDGILLVADGTQTTAAQIRACEEVLGSDTPLLGVILNRGRGSGLENYAF